MPSYAYRAIHVSGRVARGEMAAANENELALYLSESGLELIAASRKKKTALPLFNRQRALAPRLMAQFCSRLHDLLLSGIPFHDALRDAQATSDYPPLRDALLQISQSLGNGKNITESFALYPQFFPPLFLALIGAGEKSGDMTGIFDFLARYAERRARIADKLIRALRYPVFLLIVAGGAVGFMMAVVVPQIIEFLNGLQTALPFATRMLMAASRLISADGLWLALTGAVLASATLVACRLSAAVALRVDACLLNLPWIGALALKIDLARFSHSLALLFQSGCEILPALRQAATTIGNRALAEKMRQAEDKIEAGSPLSAALMDLLPPFALGLIQTGERSGKLGKCLDDIAAAYDREAQNAIDAFIAVLEPALTVIIGAVLVWTVVAVLGPLYGSLSVLGERL